MHKLSTLKNGLSLITVNLPHLESVTTMVAIGAGSRYETKEISGISHFLEHMFFKGSKKYPSAEVISTLIDGIGAVNNAATAKEYTYFWIKSAAKHIELAADILSSQIKESLLKKEEIDREKGVIVEELRMYRDNPARFVWDLYERLQFGDQPLGWDIGGDEKTVTSIKRQDIIKYINSLYAPKNMVLIFVGKLPADIEKLADQYFGHLPSRSYHTFYPYQEVAQTKPKIDLYTKQTDQVNLVLGVEAYDRRHPRRFAARVLGIILGEGMSSRLFLQVRERRGLAYHVAAGHEPYVDTGCFVAYAGLKVEKVEEGLKVIKGELEKLVAEKVSEEELKKAKEMERGRLALHSESTNFLAEYFGVKYILDREVETFEDYLKKIEAVTAEEIQLVAEDLFRQEKYNLQIIAPFKDGDRFAGILQS